MLGRLGAIGITFYNGYSFPASETVETLAYKCTPHYDTSGRTVIYSDFDVTIRWFIADATITSREVQDMVARLQRPAGILRYTGRGFGVGEAVNTGKIWDVNWGPKPGPVELKPVGAGRTVEATWQVRFSIPTCDDAIYRQGVREFCFSVEYAKDRSGLTTRTYKAHASILITRSSVGSRKIDRTADDLLESIAPDPIEGFRRESVTHSLSEDKSTITLTVVDVQFPALAPPPGCVDAQLEHSYTLAPGTLAKWTGRFVGLYEVARSPTIAVDTVRTVQDFLARVDGRLGEVAGIIIGRGLPGLPRPENDGERLGRNRIIPVGCEIAEPNAYGRRQIRISLSYLVAGVGFSEIIEKGGLWKPWGTQYNLWRLSTPTLHNPRGEAGLVFNPGDDRIIDACGRAAPATLGSGGGGGGGRPSVTQVSPAGGFTLGVIDAIRAIFPGPDPASSWVEYQCGVVIRTQTGRVVVNTLPNTPITTDHNLGNWDVNRGVTANVPSGSPFPPLAEQLRDRQSGATTTVHQRAAPTLYVTLQGHAVRVGHPVPVPELLTVGGRTPTLVGEPMFASQIVGNALVPVYAARWQMTYVVTEPPTAPIATPPNLFLA